LKEREEISIREFHSWGNTNSKVLNFLKEHHKAYTPGGIAKHIKISYKNVQASLSKLQKQNLVLHNPPYWASGIIRTRTQKTKGRGGRRIDFPPRTEKSIADAVESGKSMNKMAEKYHVSKTVIRRICKSYGVVPAKKSRFF
jgi:hypothetical protein